MNVALIGSGSWGTAVAGLAAARAERVTMWAHSEQTAAGINGEHRNPRYLVDYELPDNVVATTELAQALDDADAIIIAVPSTHLRDAVYRSRNSGPLPHQGHRARVRPAYERGHC